MKDKIFNKMKEYGWNLGDNTSEDFNKVYDCHYDNLDKWYDYISGNDYDYTMQDISKSDFSDFVDFMSDFLRALNDIDYNTDIKLDLINHYVKSRNISSDQTGQDILAIIENNEEELEELKENNTKQIDYINKRAEVCGWDKSDMYELDCLNYENEQIDKLLEEI